MATKINANTTKAFFEDAFKDDAVVLETVSTVLTFGMAATASEPLSAIAGIALITKTAATALKACSLAIKKLGKSKPNNEPDEIPNYDRFGAIFFIACQKCYIESVSESLSRIMPVASEETGIKSPERTASECDVLRAQLEMAIANLSEAEISYLFGVEPLAGDVPLFDAFGKWLVSTLSYYGISGEVIGNIVKDTDKTARQRFHSYLATDDPTSNWMRRYLALSQQHKVTKKISNDLSSMRQTLDDWSADNKGGKKRQQESWDNYRTSLQSLPDLKETMFSEQFGVRKVFVQPQVAYHIIGLEGAASRSTVVPDLGHLLGALLSTRTDGEDLIIMCGGPGSGKSTLCRVMASQLALDPNMHPIFLRLRRLKEGSDISLFIEQSLQKLGLISHISDLREMPNVVLILDGFDELVMASRSRLRHFFNLLKEEMSVGPLREAKVIVSGRDTLFPNGEGLPSGSHVLALQAFDKARIKSWGEKWRAQHQTGLGSSFKPEELLRDKEDGKQKSPLFHLVSWPLTLHLVARVHTSGNLELEGKKSHEIEKAYLYRSILADTAKRQLDQAEGKGRLSEKQMRTFLRDLAWEMYSRSIDTMDPSDVVPLLAKYYPNTNEAEIAELGDVAVVNAPELTKGEQTGFEFVHKSFAEYLVAEQLADCIERVSFKAQEYGTEELTWRMTEQEAAVQLAPMIGIRLLTEEVQEMLEPMLGCLIPFLKGDKVNDVISAPTSRDGLNRIIDRFEFLYNTVLQGKSLDAIDAHTKDKLLIHSPLEAYANYCAGLLIIGTASVRRLNAAQSEKNNRYMQCEPFKGAFWRALFILQAGGQNVDSTLTGRLLAGSHVDVNNPENKIGDRNFPLQLCHLSLVKGYKSELTSLVVEAIRSYEGIYFAAVFAITLLSQYGGERAQEFNRYLLHRFPEDILHDEPISGLLRLMIRSGLVEANAIENDRFEGREFRDFRYLVEVLRHEPYSAERSNEFFHRIEHYLASRSSSQAASFLFRAIREVSRDSKHTWRVSSRAATSSSVGNERARKSSPK